MIDELVSIGFERKFAECFYCLPGSVTPNDCETAETLKVGFKRVLRSKEAKLDRDVVFIWKLEEPYTHRTAHGHEKPTHIIYIEMTGGSVYERWSLNHIKSLCTDSGNILGIVGSAKQRRYADADCNLTFYRTLIRNFGPLTVWVAPASRLNSLNDGTSTSSGPWEGLLQELYRETFTAFL